MNYVGIDKIIKVFRHLKSNNYKDEEALQLLELMKNQYIQIKQYILKFVRLSKINILEEEIFLLLEKQSLYTNMEILDKTTS